MEQYGEYLFFGGLGVIALAWIWLLVRTFKASKPLGVVCLLLPPALLIYMVVKRRQLKAPIALLFLGLAIFAVPFALPYYERYIIGFKERARIVDGEEHLTLTGWDRKSYFMLQDKPKTIVLQMANPDVTDETLKYVAEMKDLRELDISYSQVTDAGLEILSGLPKLEKLHIRKVPITDAGFRKYLMPMPSLLMVDVQDTPVKRETIKEWRAENKKRKALQSP